MSMFVSQDTKEIQIEGETVEIKELTYGEQNQINKQAVSVNHFTKKPEMDLALMQEETLKTAIVGWTFKDAEGNVAEVNLDNIRALKPSVANEIYQTVNGENQVSEDEKK
ncbi:hypothetical protein LC065_20015 (plasmid) [Halobacillus litoralis]|uniref:hypothetical protein n=1 Tax=Halobacillus litoralis TaxID=45668 RepID=UPI001CFCFDDF|nr:hypothetical protein [Halobacillus litoralis]WLR49594.1 hypothetical protein LC065_20015 [Halobacillus litoralis]